jgi:hypothetical protein
MIFDLIYSDWPPSYITSAIITIIGFFILFFFAIQKFEKFKVAYLIIYASILMITVLVSWLFTPPLQGYYINENFPSEVSYYFNYRLIFGILVPHLTKLVACGALFSIFGFQNKDKYGNSFLAAGAIWFVITLTEFIIELAELFNYMETGKVWIFSFSIVISLYYIYFFIDFIAISYIMRFGIRSKSPALIAAGFVMYCAQLAYGIWEGLSDNVSEAYAHFIVIGAALIFTIFILAIHREKPKKWTTSTYTPTKKLSGKQRSVGAACCSMISGAILGYFLGSAGGDVLIGVGTALLFAFIGLAIGYYSGTYCFVG